MTDLQIWYQQLKEAAKNLAAEVDKMDTAHTRLKEQKAVRILELEEECANLKHENATQERVWLFISIAVFLIGAILGALFVHLAH